MKNYIFEWNTEKNMKLKKERGISFEAIVASIDDGWLIDITEHPNQDKYGHQEVLCVAWNDYTYLIPFVRDNDTLFLKTIIPSRKATKKYIH